VNTAALVSPGHRFWPVGEAAQADYETLRAHVLTTGAPPDSLIAARFARRGVAGLIAWPSAEPVFDAELLCAARPPGHRTTIPGSTRWPPGSRCCWTPARPRRPRPPARSPPRHNTMHEDTMKELPG
jgi:hypothetical protein